MTPNGQFAYPLDKAAIREPVVTASISQVREPIYSHAVERWRRYEDQLAGLARQINLIPV